MKVWAAIAGAAGVAAGVIGTGSQPQVWTVVVGGDVLGYLSPCGCTYPMRGGIKRWATAVRSLGNPDTRLVLENGGLVNGIERQDVMKAEALATTLNSVGVAALNLTAGDARLGATELDQIGQMAGSSLTSTAVSGVRDLETSTYRRRGPFLIGGAVAQAAALTQLGAAVLDASSAAHKLATQAKSEGLTAILMFDGDETQAVEIARKEPDLAMIVFSRGGDPPDAARSQGHTLLVTPGQQGKFLVRLSFRAGRFGDYGAVKLDPDVTDDAKVSTIYARYLRRVDKAGLLDAFPRTSRMKYVGSDKCGSCHAPEFEVWKRSKHSQAFADLSSDGHGRDPECVACHVTGLDSTGGFVSRDATPGLSHVGCESCHGAGEAHSAEPNLMKLAKIGPETCKPCHTSENSPGFDFLTFWPKIKHGQRRK